MSGVKKIMPQETFTDLEDPPKHRVCEYPLAEIMFVAFAGLLCGEESYVGMREIAEERISLYRQYLPFANGIPSESILEYVLRRLDVDRVQELCMPWLMDAIGEFREKRDGHDTMAVGSKRRWRTKDRDRNLLHVVTVYDSAARPIIGQLGCMPKNNKFAAAVDLIEMIDVKDAMVTADAMGTRDTIANLIIKKGGDYLLCVKKNRKALYLELEEYFTACMENECICDVPSYACIRDGEHGHFEKYECWVTDDLSALPQTQKWKGAKGAAMMRRQSEVDCKTTDEVQYVLFSRVGMPAEVVLAAVRQHVNIGNGLRWVLDVTFRPNDSGVRMDDSGENLNAIRHVVFSILKLLKDSGESYSSLRRKCLLNDNFFNQIVELAGFVTKVGLRL